MIHYASFEKRILGKEGFEINGIVDTHKISKRYRGGSGKGRHTLQTVCERELSVTIDKTCQTSNWMRRPLSRSQMHYAAMAQGYSGMDTASLYEVYKRAAGIEDIVEPV